MMGKEMSKKRGRLKDRDEGCCQLKVSLLGLVEEHRKWSSVEVNGLLTRQDRRPAMCVYMCVCVRPVSLMDASY